MAMGLTEYGVDASGRQAAVAVGLGPAWIFLTVMILLPKS
jgi:hypothetical protein